MSPNLKNFNQNSCLYDGKDERFMIQRCGLCDWKGVPEVSQKCPDCTSEGILRPAVVMSAAAGNSGCPTIADNGGNDAPPLTDKANDAAGMDMEHTYVELTPALAERLGLGTNVDCTHEACNCLEGTIDDDTVAPTADDGEEFEEVDIICAGDSACADHILNKTDIPGYDVRESEGSKAGKGWMAADGMRIQNEGEAELNLVAKGRKVRSTFQVGRVSRPLMSIARICDAGNTVLFNKTHAIVRDSNNREVCRFDRKGQLYLIKFRLKAPEKPATGFRRPGKQ